MHRYRERGESEISVANRRFAGKLYLVCPQHGRMGGAANDHATQEYILAKSNMPRSGEKSPANPPKKDPAPAPAPVRPPAQAPAKSKDEEPEEEAFWPWE